ncbi:MAG TPA: KilA-N domain-containing protein [Niabella sp.]|nr:KilA-N domain-containing protein [Niabella sp.]HOZ95414.1 KilA-N domain-containing protein [Niabella sp.]HQW14303.1 KilA-N domain-containing protein [Niabella sp.]HQX18417.1 KilA-N domain-containing protein [Niabella sp.]HQX40091.1 KilA-N domain-containing protein [Niabella sp.]
MAKINVKETEITLFRKEQEDYISLTDIAKTRDKENPSQIISLWLRTFNTIEYIGLWEMLNNPDFKPHIYEGFKNESAKPHFWMSPQKWSKETNAIGIISKSGRYGGGTFAHSDIAFKFASWISAEFELYLVREFKRLKEEEQKQIGWSAKRELAKINYHIHTDAIKTHLIPKELTSQETSIIYANEADVLNMALFGMTAKQWREQNPKLKGNVRDYATINELICLSNLENINALLINEQVAQNERLIKLNHIAIQQMSVLQQVENRNLLK